MLFMCFFMFSLSLFIILSQDIMKSILGLVSTVVTISMFLFFMGFEFISYLFLIVYVGAVLILFLFVMMMLNLNTIFYSLNSFCMFFLFMIFILKFMFTFNLFMDSLEHGTLLYTFTTNFSCVFISNSIMYNMNDILIFSSLYLHMWYNTIISSLLLLVGMIGSVSLCQASVKLLWSRILHFI